MEKILEQYGRVTVYMEPNHPSPMYYVDGGAEPNPYGNLAVLLEDDNLEEIILLPNFLKDNQYFQKFYKKFRLFLNWIDN